MTKLSLSKVGLISNVLILFCLLLQALKYYVIYKFRASDIDSSWKSKVMKIGAYSSICINPILIWLGIFGDYRTLLVILAYIALQLLLVFGYHHLCCFDQKRWFV